MTVPRLIGILFSLLVLTGLARAGEVPPEKISTILTRALAYDQSLKARTNGAVVIAVLYKNGDARSLEDAEAMYPAFKRLDHVRVQGLPISTVKLAFEGAASLKAQIAARGITLLFVCDGLSNALPQIVSVTRSRRVISSGISPDDVRDGLSIGVFMDDSQRAIVINLAASREEGADFSSELLHLARVLK